MGKMKSGCGCSSESGKSEIPGSGINCFWLGKNKKANEKKNSKNRLFIDS